MESKRELVNFSKISEHDEESKHSQWLEFNIIIIGFENINFVLWHVLELNKEFIDRIRVLERHPLQTQQEEQVDTP